MKRILKDCRVFIQNVELWENVKLNYSNKCCSDQGIFGKWLQSRSGVSWTKKKKTSKENWLHNIRRTWRFQRIKTPINITWNHTNKQKENDPKRNVLVDVQTWKVNEKFISFNSGSWLPQVFTLPKCNFLSFSTNSQRTKSSIFFGKLFTEVEPFKMVLFFPVSVNGFYFTSTIIDVIKGKCNKLHIIKSCVSFDSIADALNHWKIKRR